MPRGAEGDPLACDRWIGDLGVVRRHELFDVEEHLRRRRRAREWTDLHRHSLPYPGYHRALDAIMNALLPSLIVILGLIGLAAIVAPRIRLPAPVLLTMAGIAWALGMVDLLRARTNFTVGLNEPYSPSDRVYFTLERHARSRSLPAVMIEVRNDEIASEQQQAYWGDLLSGVADAAFRELNETGAGSEPVHAKNSKG